MRKQLYRAGEILQELVYVHREKNFDMILTKVEKKPEGGDTMYIHETDYAKKRKSGKITALGDLVYPFPSDLIPDLRDKQAVLAHLACDDAVGWMHDVVQYFLGGIAKSITETAVQPKNKKRCLIAVKHTGKIDSFEYKHVFLTVELKNGEKYVLDFAGAQLGYYEPVTPLSLYSAERVDTDVHLGWNAVQPFGTRLQIMKSLMETRDKGTYSGYQDMLNSHTGEGLKLASESWCEVRQLPLAKMLLLPEKEFEMRKKDLVEQVGNALQSALEGARFEAP
ncbi:hypothetical protein LSUE1_G007922 [Lachnellula suecica]|uniref:Uncharacterized protein n=1 Tax=Lachnellula suecica TaxID=602035 RepID=A0A8T9BTJ9_9HELO|nr:hypothetical protein LSUE1_G007922 [Lachnellula suecica]